MTSPLRPACPRTLTLLAMTMAGPGMSGTLLNSASISFFFAVAGFAAFFFDAFFLAGAAPGALVRGGTAGDSSAAGEGGLLGCCAGMSRESRAQKIIQQVFFINQPSRDLISGSVNVRHLPGGSSPSLIFPICTRCSLL